ncbi:Protein of unknown function (DUF3889) [Schinkia azotoformans MEV2011]|uniref:Uncharacterized protein n=1 Tax=Schinkia azotoformans MEV2011 TaxID=1348973 RepID=A0A072NW30_SCHAZ|nr:DUF3889 domain-containing protein [Schinkia azotoformans]KEF37460.1 Protein of unknown function (DUF3889) [Schinkia azotoformans MEV2011]MEC1697785.1 DUF3889 domain-containing protein [Schinkia azotoformans]MEC1726199.1 DUF3889 domain-containing protein [Schinkia azotoformans]MEC1780101.1 DUF3889 domain-containing protein [Schinkia azotoformans]MED4330820.1 DUF3889 domain-containing protein [Schinkia azotoformans]
MWPHYYPGSNINPNIYGTYQYPTFHGQPYDNYNTGYLLDTTDNWDRQRPIRGQATWTTGGQVTKCGIPWSKNEYMTVAVGENSPYKCGQTLKIRNLTSPGQREIIVTIVDTVAGYPGNKVNLHRNAFIALGANPSIGVINVEIIPSPELEKERWGKYLLEIIKTAYPTYNVTDFHFIRKTHVSPSQTKETYEYIVHSGQDNIRIQGNVVYNPNTDRVTSIDFKEIEHFERYDNLYF